MQPSQAGSTRKGSETLCRQDSYTVLTSVSPRGRFYIKLLLLCRQLTVAEESHTLTFKRVCVYVKTTKSVDVSSWLILGNLLL